MYGHWKGDGSHRNGSRSRSVGDVGDGFFESSLRPNWDALENRHGDDWENVRGVGTRALLLYGYITHYTIGVGLAVTYVLGWDLLVGGPASPVWALAYGVATTVASHFFVFPSMGLGVFGRRSPEGIRVAVALA
jgi:hypothetical protein